MNDLHYEPSYSDESLSIHSHNSSYVSPTGFDFGAFIVARATEVLADMKNISDYWNANPKADMDAYI